MADERVNETKLDELLAEFRELADSKRMAGNDVIDPAEEISS